MDEDLDRWTREELLAEVRRLRDGIRAHRDSSESLDRQAPDAPRSDDEYQG